MPNSAGLLKYHRLLDDVQIPTQLTQHLRRQSVAQSSRVMMVATVVVGAVRVCVVRARDNDLGGASVVVCVVRGGA